MVEGEEFIHAEAIEMEEFVPQRRGRIVLQIGAERDERLGSGSFHGGEVAPADVRLVGAHFGHVERLRAFLDQRHELRVVVMVAIGDRHGRADVRLRPDQSMQLDVVARDLVVTVLRRVVPVEALRSEAG